PYIVMEYLEGWDLEHLLVKRGRLPLKEAVGYVLEACEAIAEAHAAGIVHRDLKPGNLFLGTRPDGSPLVKVLDFGVSKLLPSASRALRDEVKTGPHVVMGSPLYSSPEQLRAASGVDARSDIWALGAILYEMLAGEPPFVAETFVEACAKIAHSPFRPLCKRRPDLPPGIDAVLAGALAKTPEDRFPSVADFARELGAFASDRATLLVERIVNVARRATQGGTLADTLPSRTDPSLALPPFVASTTLTRPRKSERPGARWWVLSGVVATALFAWLVFGLPRAPAPPVLSAGTAPVTPAPLSAVPVTTTRAVDAPLEPRPQVSQEPPIATPQRQPAPTVQTATTPQRRPRSREGRPPDTAGFGGLQ
ncbi:MAG TPA: protein kinase, partial [Polyangiaceae bacterium]